MGILLHWNKFWGWFAPHTPFLGYLDYLNSGPVFFCTETNLEGWVLWVTITNPSRGCIIAVTALLTPNIGVSLWNPCFFFIAVTYTNVVLFITILVYSTAICLVNINMQYWAWSRHFVLCTRHSKCFTIFFFDALGSKDCLFSVIENSNIITAVTSLQHYLFYKT